MQNRVKRNNVLRRLSCEMASVKAMYYDIVSDVGLAASHPSCGALECGNGLTEELSDGKFNIVIGSCDFPSKWHMYVDMSLFCEMMLAVKHEQQHVHQHAVTYRNAIPDNISMLKDYVSTFYNPRYYRYNYGKMLHEIDANIESIKATRDYFKKNFPDYDVDADLCQIMYDRQSCSQYGWFTDEHRRFESVDAMLESMYTHKAKVSQYRSHFMYTRRSPDEPMDCLEEYLDSSPRSVRLPWDDMNGLEQRDFAAKVIMGVHPDDVKNMQILFSENAFPDLSDDGDLVIEHQEEIGYE